MKHFTLLLASLLFLVFFSGQAQSLSGQAKLITPSVLSGCNHDTICVEVKNLVGPVCPDTLSPSNLATIAVTIPGDTLVPYVLGSLSSNATFVSYSNKVLTFTVPMPVYGATKKICFAVLPDCKVGMLNNLPKFEATISYPASFGTPNETFNSGFINVGVGNLYIQEYPAYFGPTATNNGSGRAQGTTNYSVLFFGNTGYGDIRNVRVTRTVDNALNVQAPLWTASNPGWDQPGANGEILSSINDGTKTTTVFSLTSSNDNGFNLGPDHKLAAGQAQDRLLHSTFFAPNQCGTWEIKYVIEWLCADGSPSCQAPQTFVDVVTIGAGTPKLDAVLNSSQLPDGCPNKHIQYTIKNNGVGNAAPVGNAYDVDFNINLGAGLIQMSNLTFNGIAVPNAAITTAGISASNFKINLKDINTLAYGGLTDLDADGKLDDMLVGDSVVVDFDYTIPCTDACGANMFNTLSANNTFTDFCRTLNGVTSTELLKFGFEQAQPLMQSTPTPDYGVWADAVDTKTKTADFNFQYKQHNLNLAAATAKLIINYSNRFEVNPSTILINGVPPTNAPVLMGTQAATPAYGLADGNPIAGSPAPYGAYPNIFYSTYATDNDSAYVIDLTPIELAAMFDNTPDNLKYDATYYGCGKRQNQNNGDNWQLLVSLLPTGTLCSNGSTPCTFDLACKKPYSYSSGASCSGKPCYISNLQLNRVGPDGSTDITLATTSPTMDLAKSYEGDTVEINIGSFISSQSWTPLNVGNFNGGSRWKDGRFYFSTNYTIPKGWPGTSPYTIFDQFLGGDVVIHSYTPTAPGSIVLNSAGIGPAIFTAPLQLSDLGITPTTSIGFPNAVFYQYPAPYGSLVGGPAWQCLNGGTWWLGGAFNCPVQDAYWYDPTYAHGIWGRRMNIAGDKVSDEMYLIYGDALERAGYTGDLGDPNIYIEIKPRFRMNKAFPWDNSNDWNVYGGFEHYGNGETVDYLSPASDYYASCNYVSATHLTMTKEEMIGNPAEVYSAACNLTVHNKINFKSYNGNYFQNGEVRVPYKVDSVVVEIPTEYAITTGTNSLTTGGGNAVTGYTAIANSASTGHVVFTNTGSAPHTYSDFPRFDDAAGTGNIPTTVFDLQYAITKVGSAAPTVYPMPIKIYTRDEHGNVIILTDTATISEAAPDLVLTPITPILNNTDGGTCTPAFFDFKIQNNTLFDAPNSYFAITTGGVSNIVDITDGDNTYVDPIIAGDTSRHNVGGSNGMIVKLGTVGAGDIRIVRVFATTTSCSGTLIAYADFGCAYPSPLEPVLSSPTIDISSANYMAQLPNLLSSPVGGDINVADLCANKAVEIEFKNVNNSNLYKTLAGIKLPANVTYVAGSAKLSAPTPSTYVLVPSTDVILTGTDSITIDFKNMAPLNTACGMEGADKIGQNIYRFKFDVQFNSCPANTIETVLYQITGENYCGTQVVNKGAVRFNYIGTASTANNYTTSASLKPIALCASVGQSQTIIDTLWIKNLGGFGTSSGVSSGVDSIVITIPVDASVISIGNIILGAPFSSATQVVDAQGHLTLRTTVPAGIAVGDSIPIPMTYNLSPQVLGACAASGGTCASLSFYADFTSNISLACVSKGLNCNALTKVTRGSNLTPRAILCCASIGDKVWIDSNNNGLQEISEPGISGVIVNLYTNGIDGLPNTGDDVLVATDTTDANGNYFFANLYPSLSPTQEYSVGFILPIGSGIAKSIGSGDNQNPLNSDAGTTINGVGEYRTGSYNLASGESDSTVDAGIVPLASFGNFVWNDLNGNGIQEPGEPGIANQYFDIWNVGPDGVLGGGDDTYIGSDSTDLNGYYYVNNLYPGNYQAFLYKPTLPTGYVASPSINGGDNQNPTNSDGTNLDILWIASSPISLIAGEHDSTVDFGVHEPFASIGDKVWLDNNKDGLQDAGEPGVAGVTVTLYNTAGTIVGSTVTDAMGNYKFENLIPGDYTVGFTPPANYTFTQGAAGAGTDNNNNTNSDASIVTGPTFGRSGVITLSPGEYDSTIDAGLVLPTPNTATVGDYVWFDTNGDGIQDPTEQGISGVVVTLKDGSGYTIATTITDANGKYVFTDVTPGSNYTVEFGQPIGLVPTASNGTLSDPLNSDMNPITHSSAPFNVAAGDSIMTIDAGFVQQSSTTASLGDRVWFDANNNGIQDSGEVGVADVTVNLYDATGTNVIATTTTDALGNYVFNNLAAGTYVVGFDPTSLPAGTNFTAQNAGTDSTIDGNANPTTGMTSPIVLNAGDRNMTIDAGIYSPTNTNSIGDYVWYDANKDGIQDASEAPVSGVMVILYDVVGNAVAVTTTDATGHYLFPNLPNGTFSVGFSNLPEGFGFTSQETSPSATGSDASPSTGKTASVTLTGNTNITDLDAGIYPQGSPSQTASLGNKVWYDLNNDGIQDPGETGVAGVTVTLLDAGADGILGTADDGPSQSMVTNSLGEYLFTGLPAGNYAVQFSNLPAGYTTSPQNASGNPANDSNVPSGLGGTATTPVITLGAGEDNLTIDAGINKPTVNSIGNYVWIDANQDGQQGSPSTEPGVSGVMVTLYNADGTTYDSNPSTAGTQPLVTTTDANGYYLFTNLPDGTYSVGFSNLPSGYQYTTQEATNTATGSDANSSTGRTGTVTVAGGQTNLTLDAGIYSTTKAALGNYVWNDANSDGIQDANEAPIAGVLVTLYDGSGNPIATTVTDATGHYLFPNLDPGTYSVGFTNLPDGMVFTTQETNPSATGSDVNPATGKTAPITLAAGEINLDVDAGVKPKPVGGLGDYVWYDTNKDGLQSATESGVPGVIATLKDATTGAVLGTAVTDGNGYYLFPNLDPSIQYTVTFSNLPISYEFTQSIGTLTDPTNSDANTTTGTTSAAIVTAGAINPNVDAGISQPYASLGDRVWYDVNQDGVQDPGEVGVAGITVMLYDAAGQVVGSTVTDAYGNYLFPNLSPGDYTVKFSLPQGFVFSPSTGTSETDSLNSDVNPITGKTTTVTLSAGENQLNIDAGIYAPKTTTATVGNFVWNDTNGDGVQDPGEVGISGVTVKLYDVNGIPVATTITDANGFYQFTDVQPGTYSVGVTPPVGYTSSPNNGPVNNPSNSDINASTGTTSPFTVNAGDQITYVDAGLTQQPSTSASLGDKVWYDVNQNGVQDPGETGVIGVTVTLYEADGTTVISTTTTDGFGNYIFNGLSAGQYVVGFSNLPTDYTLTSTTGTDSTTNSDASQATGKTPVITLNAGDHNMTYDAGIYNTNPANTNSIGDKVWNDLNQDGIQDPNEPGVAGVTVTLYDNTNTPIATTSTDANGNYLFPDLPNGTYSVGFSNLPAGFVFSPTGAGTTSTDSDPNPSDGKTGSISLTGNTNVTDVDAGISQGNLNIGLASLGDKVWYDLNGDGLQDPGELGVEGATVTLYASDGTTMIATTTTDALGNYIFTDLPSGTYVVGFTDLPIGFTTSPKNADSEGINGESNSDVNIATGKTDPIILGSGEQKMSVDMGLVPPANTASLGDLVWFDLNNNGLQDANEPGVQGVTVTLYDATGEVVGVTSTDANGSYSFVGLTPDTYSVGFSNLPNGYNLTTPDADATGINGASNSDASPTTGMSASVTLTAGQNNPNLDAGIVSTTVASVGDFVWQDLNGNGIQDANEPGIGGVIVTLYDITGTPVTSTITNPDGSYIFTNVTPGDYTMGFSNIPSGLVFTTQESNPTDATGSNVNPSTSKTPTFTVTAGTHNPTIDAGLKPTPNAGLGNYVWLDFNEDGIQDASEPGVAGILVTLYAADGTTVLATAVTDGNGAYSFTNLDAGTYIVGFSNLPTGATRTKVNGVLNDTDNSDMNLDGKTLPITLTNGQYNPNIDAGIYVGIPLDVNLENVVAIANNCRTEISWSTSAEKNSDYFAILRRAANEANFTEIGKVKAKGNSQTLQQYRYNDMNVESGYYEYKLAIHDIDQKVTFSEIQTVTIDCSSEDQISIYPNPFIDVVNINIHAETEDIYEINVIDMNGKVVMSTSVDMDVKVKTVQFNLSSLSSGVYQIRIVNSGITNIYKVNKLK